MIVIKILDNPQNYWHELYYSNTIIHNLVHTTDAEFTVILYNRYNVNKN